MQCELRCPDFAIKVTTPETNFIQEDMNSG